MIGNGNSLPCASIAASAIALSQRRALCGQLDCAAFLYRFNTFPQQWVKTHALGNYADWLLNEGLGASPGLLSRFHRLFDPAGESKDWRFWTRIDESHSSPRAEPCPKLYLGVSPNHLIVALQHVAEAILAVPPTTMKFPKTSKVALRPDKLILYFETFEELERCAERMSQLLPLSLEGQSVPFTKRTEGCKFLFTASDPVMSKDDDHHVSWRSSVTDRLNACILESLPNSHAGLSTFLSEVSRGMSESGFDLHDWGMV